MRTFVSSKRAPSNPSGRWLMSDELWSELQPLLPPPPKRELSKGGRPRVPDRKAMNGILFVLRTGCQWDALNATGNLQQLDRALEIPGMGRGWRLPPALGHGIEPV